MLPPWPCATICVATYFPIRNVPVSVTAITRSHSAFRNVEDVLVVADGNVVDEDIDLAEFRHYGFDQPDHVGFFGNTGEKYFCLAASLADILGDAIGKCYINIDQCNARTAFCQKFGGCFTDVAASPCNDGHLTFQLHVHV